MPFATNLLAQLREFFVLLFALLGGDLAHELPLLNSRLFSCQATHEVHWHVSISARGSGTSCKARHLARSVSLLRSSSRRRRATRGISWDRARRRSWRAL